MNETDPRKQQLEDLDLEIKKRLNGFNDLPNKADLINSALDQRMSSQIELLLKEVKNISLISVTAAPFSLNVLLTSLNVNIYFLITSFATFMFNVMILNIGVWYINNKFLTATSSQKLEGISMGMTANKITDESLSTNERTDALINYNKSESNLNTKRQVEPYKYINIIRKIRFFGITLLTLAIILLIAATILPLLKGLHHNQLPLPASSNKGQQLKIPITSTTEPVQNPASSTPVEVEEKPKVLMLADRGISITKNGDKSLLADTQTGISFSYPTGWGPVEVEDEKGECATTIKDPCNLRIYLFFPDTEISGVFLATETAGHEQNPVGRGGFWGDGAGTITESFASKCTPKNKCELITNREGTILAKERGVWEFGDDEITASKKIKYYTFSNKGPYHGMILTASRFSAPGDALEKQFEDVVIASLKLSDH